MLRKLESKLQINLDKLLYQEELMWFQRAKVQWMVNGDRNTKFYHTKFVQRRREKVINMIKDDEGIRIEDEERIKYLFKAKFQDLHTKDLEISAWCNTKHSFYTLNSQHRKILEAEVKPMEIKNALFSMVAWKSHGLDGFPTGFYQST